MAGCFSAIIMITKVTTSRKSVAANSATVRVIGLNNVNKSKMSIQEYKIDLKTGCWNYSKISSITGYGYYYEYIKKGIYIRGQAHRYFYEKEKGKIPKGLDLDHLCRNRSCVNPAHLEPVSRSVNVQRGLLSKLTKNEVNEIISSYKRRSRGRFNQNGLARKFKVDQSTISYIISKKRWIK